MENVQKRIAKEKKRLNAIFKQIEESRKDTVAGLIERAAFMRVSLEDLEEDLELYGFTELFSQGNQEPYLRERPATRIYNSMNTSYQKIIKQLTDLLPKGNGAVRGGDEFEDF